MGNCLVLQQQHVIKIMKIDGKILEFKAPIKAEQVLSEFSNHALSDKLPVLQHLQPETKLTVGHLYYLVPLPLQLPKVRKKKTMKKVRFANQEGEDDRETRVVRVKLLISKKELQEMLQNDGASAEEMISQYRIKHVNSDDTLNYSDGLRQSKTILEGIPEEN